MRLEPRLGFIAARFFFHPAFGPRFLGASVSSGLSLSAILLMLSCIISSLLRWMLAWRSRSYLVSPSGPTASSSDDSSSSSDSDASEASAVGSAAGASGVSAGVPATAAPAAASASVASILETSPVAAAPFSLSSSVMRWISRAKARSSRDFAPRGPPLTRASGPAPAAGNVPRGSSGDAEVVTGSGATSLRLSRVKLTATGDSKTIEFEIASVLWLG